MLRIGDFSRLCGVSVRSLKHYEALGLLYPAHVDSSNGYRYYSSLQLISVSKIRMLQDMGFKLKWIRENLQDYLPEAPLDEQVANIDRQIAHLQEQRRRILTYKNIMDSSLHQQYHAVLKRIPARVCVYRDVRDIPKERLPEEIKSFAENVRGQMPVRERDELCTVAFLDNSYLDHQHMNVRLLCELSSERRGTAETVTLPQIRQAASVMVRRGYPYVSEAYMFLYQWLEQNGFRQAAPPVERYWDARQYSHTDEYAEVIVEIQLPVEKE